MRQRRQFAGNTTVQQQLFLLSHRNTTAMSKGPKAHVLVTQTQKLLLFKSMLVQTIKYSIVAPLMLDSSVFSCRLPPTTLLPHIRSGSDMTYRNGHYGPAIVANFIVQHRGPLVPSMSKSGCALYAIRG